MGYMSERHAELQMNKDISDDGMDFVRPHSVAEADRRRRLEGIRELMRRHFFAEADIQRLARMQATVVGVMLTGTYACEHTLFRAVRNAWAQDHLLYSGQDELLIARVVAQAWQAKQRSDARRAEQETML